MQQRKASKRGHIFKPGDVIHFGTGRRFIVDAVDGSRGLVRGRFVGATGIQRNKKRIDSGASKA